MTKRQDRELERANIRDSANSISMGAMNEDAPVSLDYVVGQLELLILAVCNAGDAIDAYAAAETRRRRQDGRRGV